VRFQEECGVLRLLCQGEEALCHVPCGLQFGTDQVKALRARERREELGSFTDLLAERERARVDGAHCGGSQAFGGHQGSSQADLQCEFSLGALAGVGQGFQ
jgi:hypothetical protein